MKNFRVAPATRRGLLLGGAVAALSACSPLQTLNAVSAGGSGHQARAGVPYGELPRQRLDLYTPAFGIRPPEGWPMVVFFYGGSWSSGEREDYRFVGAALAERGIVTLVADYRLYPQVTYPAFLQDCALALAYGLREAARLGADSRRVFVMGHSAGGYNAAMLALDPRWLRAVGHSPRELAGWIGLAGAYDFFPSQDPELQAVFHHPDYPAGGQPIDHVRSDAPRTFIGASPKDKVVSYERSAVALATRLKGAGVPVTFKSYPDASHQTTIGAFAWPLRYAGPVLNDVVAFVRDGPPAAPR